ncbi:mitochondrial nicotinamide adenine dinucleotide transporter 1 [[Candida] anglica]
MFILNIHSSIPSYHLLNFSHSHLQYNSVNCLSPINVCLISFSHCTSTSCSSTKYILSPANNHLPPTPPYQAPYSYSFLLHMLTDRQIETVAGLCAGFSTTVITHPLDLIKVRLQLSKQPPSSQPFSLLRHVISNINDSATIAQSSQHATRSSQRFMILLRQYYRGLTPNLIGNISAWSLYFTLYAEFKSIVKTNSQTVNYFASSAMAGATTSLITNPIWVLKTRILGTSSHESRAYHSILDGVHKIWKNEGISAFWKGSIPSMFSVAQASLQFTFYDHLKNYFGNRPMNTDGTQSIQLSTSQYIYASATAKTLSMVIMYPSQMIKSRLQTYQSTSPPTGQAKVITTNGNTITGVCKDIWVHEGKLRGFYKGVGANMLRVVPATCITFVVYEKVRGQLRGDRESDNKS